MEKFKLNFIDYNNNQYLNFDYNDFYFLHKKGYNQVNIQDIAFWSDFKNYYNHDNDYTINNEKYYRSYIRYINFLNNTFYNISFKITSYWSLLVFIVTKKKNFKTFQEYWKDKKYYWLYKQLRENKKNYKNIDLFNNYICKKTRYNKYFWLYEKKKDQIEKTVKAISEKNINLSKLARDNFILYKYDNNNHVENTNRIIFYKNWIWLYDKQGKVIKTFTYKNNINVLDYVKL